MGAESVLPHSSWRLLSTGFLSGKANMELDETLVKGLLGGKGGASRKLGDAALPALRFYRWRPWAVSLGYHQRPDHLTG